MSWTKEDQARLRTLHTKCMTVKEIAKEMQKPQGWIRDELKAMGYKPIEVREKPESEFLKGSKKKNEIPKRVYNCITPETEKKICELREQCFTISQIKQKLNLHDESAVRNVLKRNGYPTERGKYHKETKEDKPMKAAQINEEFDKAVDEMIAEAKEKEPASSANDTSSEVSNTPISTSNDTIETQKSQAISGITALSLLESALMNAYGGEAEIIDINANADHCDIGFAYHGKEYCLLFAEREEVPAYGNDKH